MNPNLQLTNNFILKKQFFIILFGVLLGFSITHFVMVGDSENSGSLSILSYTLTSFLGIALSELLYYSSWPLDQFFPFQKNTGLRLFLGIVGHFFMCYILIYFSIYIYSALVEDVLNFSVTYNEILIKIGILVFIAILLFEVIYFAFYSYNSYTTFQIASVKQKRKQIELQLKALKSQLSPHFLFNSFNTISSLIYKDVSKAGTFIRKLANLYQYTLDSYNVKLVNMSEELDFVNSYLFLLQTRFQDSFHCKIDLPEEIKKTKIPPLALQMLIENAVKHNQLQKENPLKIVIQKENDFISVTNNITEASHNISSFKIGLKNINSRYLLLAGKGIQISNGQQFQVKIPIIK